MPDLQFAVEKLRRAQDGLLRAADSVPSGDWNIPPEVNAWSAAQLVAHLCQVERGVLGYADRVTVCVTLFALLELYKQGEASWAQPEPFGEILVSARADAAPARRRAAG